MAASKKSKKPAPKAKKSAGKKLVRFPRVKAAKPMGRPALFKYLVATIRYKVPCAEFVSAARETKVVRGAMKDGEIQVSSVVVREDALACQEYPDAIAEPVDAPGPTYVLQPRLGHAVCEVLVGAASGHLVGHLLGGAA